MSLSKKNLDKLNNLKKNKNLINNNNNKFSRKNIDNQLNISKLEDPNKIFYSLIDNSETLNETSEANQLLKDSEKDYININPRKTYYSKNLSKKDELYDEFNYLLDE